MNIADAPLKNASASVGIVGDLGAGKSVLEKLLTSAVVDRGGRAIVIDRTPIREWATFARSSAGQRCQVIDAANAELSIDPLRVFGGAIGAHYALSYLTLQLGVGPMSASGAVLHHAVEAAAAGGDPSMTGVVEALNALADGAAGASTRRDAAATMADLLRIAATNPLAAMVFDSALPPVTLDGDLGADMVVVTTTGLTLPPREAFGNVDVLRQQPLEALALPGRPDHQRRDAEGGRRRAADPPGTVPRVRRGQAGVRRPAVLLRRGRRPQHGTC